MDTATGVDSPATVATAPLTATRVDSLVGVTTTTRVDSLVVVATTTALGRGVVVGGPNLEGGVHIVDELYVHCTPPPVARRRYDRP